VTSQGSAHGRFTRAIKTGNLFGAEMAAREMGRLPVGSALDLVVLIAKQNPRGSNAQLCAGMDDSNSKRQR